jgi:hypothetical protein
MIVTPDAAAASVFMSWRANAKLVEEVRSASPEHLRPTPGDATVDADAR